MAAIKRTIQLECAGSGKIDKTQEIEKLLKKLSSELTSVRKKAMESLASMGEPGILALIEALDDDVSYMYVHPEIVETLSSIGKPAVLLLIQSLDNESDANIQWDLLEALSAIGEPSINSLLQMLESKKPVERSNAARALGLMGDKRALEPLIKILTYDAASGPKACALEALGKIENAKATDALIRSLDDEDAWVRREAAKALGKIKDKKAVEPLIKLLKDPVYKVRADAATALKEIGDERAVGPLIEVLDSRGGGHYWSADFFIKDAILSFKTKDTVELLINTFKSDNVDIKKTAAEVLAKMGNVALKPLIQALNDEGMETRYYAVKSLGLKGDKRAIKALRRVAEKEWEDWDVKKAAESALWEIEENNQ